MTNAGEDLHVVQLTPSGPSTSLEPELRLPRTPKKKASSLTHCMERQLPLPGRYETHLKLVAKAEVDPISSCHLQRVKLFSDRKHTSLNYRAWPTERAIPIQVPTAVDA